MSETPSRGLTPQRLIAKPFLLLLLSFVFTGISFSPLRAQVWNSPMGAGASNYFIPDLYSTTFVSSTAGWACGGSGAILNTVDGGVNWTPQTSNSAATLKSIYFPSTTNGWAVGTSGAIVATSTAGATWTAQTSGTTQTLSGVYFISATTGWAVGSNGTILYTSNGGSTWSAQTSGTTTALTSVYFISATNGYAVGSGGIILATTNGGTTWTSQTSGTASTINSVYFVSATTGWAAANAGVILYTTNGGTTWIAQTSNTTQNVNCVKFISATIGWASCTAGVTLRTTNGGTTWTAQTLPTGSQSSMSSLYFTSATTGWMVGGFLAGRIWNTTDGGVTWSPQVTGSSQNYFGSYFISATTGWVVGNSGYIFKTTDGGHNWVFSQGSAVQQTRCVHFPSATNGWAATANGTMMVSTNGGSTWSNQTSGASTIYGVYFTSTTNGCFVGISGTIGTTTNAGTTWTLQTSGSSQTLFGVAFASTTTGIAVGGSGTILKTTDGGTTWATISSGTTQQLNGVCFPSSSIGYIAGSGGVILKTTDGGSTWTSLTSPTGTTLNGVSFFDTNTGWAVSSSGGIYFTSNGGTSWTSETSNVITSLTTINALSATTAVASGSAGVILLRSCVGTAGITGTPTACGSVSLTATGGTSYAWSGGSTPNTAANTFTTSGTYTVTSTNSLGCTATAQQAVVINPSPVATASNTGPYCPGQTIALSSGPASQSSYNWTGPNSFSTQQTYTQNFDGLGTGNVSWTDNSTLPGWYLLQGQGNTTAPATAVSLLTADNGAGTTGTVYNYNNTTTTSDRALGSLASNSISNSGYAAFIYGVKVTNNTSNTLTTATITYTGEQYRNGGNTTAQTLTVDYSTNATGIATAAGTWTNVSALTFTSLINTATAATLDGNAAANRTANITATLTGLSIAPGASIWVRWNDLNDSGNDHGLAIDDVSISLGSQQNPTIANATTAMSGTYTVTVTGSNGCTGTSSTSVVVNSVPTASITGTATACGSVSLTASGGTSYSWSGGSTPSTAANTFTTSGTYRLTVTNASGCTATASQVVTVNTVPTAGITGTATGCGSVSLTATGGTSYSWSGGAATTSATNTFTSSGTYTVTVTAATTCTASASQVVTISPSSVAATSTTASPDHGCMATVTLTATGYTAGANATLNWYTGAGGTGTNVGTGSPLTITPPTGITTYYARLSGTCNTVETNVSVPVGGSVNVELTPASVATAQIICQDGAWSYYENPADPGKYIFAINWDPNGDGLGANSTAAKAAAVVSLGVNSNYYSVTTLANGGPQGTWAMSRDWNINDGGLPLDAEGVNIRFYYDPTEKTAIETAAQSWATANGSTYEGFLWFKTVGVAYDPTTQLNYLGVAPGSTIALTPTAISTENGITYAQFNNITSFSGGTGTAGVGAGNALPLTLLTFSGVNEGKANHLFWTTATEQNLNRFDVMRSKDGTHFSKIGEVAATGNTTTRHDYPFVDVHPYTGYNYYQLMPTDKDGVTHPTNIIVLNVHADKPTLVNLYPNPANTIVYFDMYSPDAENVSCQLTDNLGRVVRSFAIDLIEGANSQSLDVSSLPSGVYYLHFTCCGGEVFTQKIDKGRE